MNVDVPIECVCQIPCPPATTPLGAIEDFLEWCEGWIEEGEISPDLMPLYKKWMEDTKVPAPEEPTSKGKE